MIRLIAAITFMLAAGTASAVPPGEVVSPKGKFLAQQLDAMGVETKWMAGSHIDWRTGEPHGHPQLSEGRHTHCSAFVAAAAEKLGVHILRPPEHSQVLLANAQYEWLSEEGASEGWRSLPDGKAAQAAANRGDLVVASYLSHRASKPGHIAIVKPAARSAAEIADEGPLVIQAGAFNRDGVSLREGFAGHPAAWRDDEIAFFAHTIAAPASLAKN